MSTSTKRWRKLWSFLLAAAMVLSMLTPTAIFAQTDDATAAPVEIEAEAPAGEADASDEIEAEVPAEGADEAADIEEAAIEAEAPGGEEAAEEAEAPDEAEAIAEEPEYAADEAEAVTEEPEQAADEAEAEAAPVLAEGDGADAVDMDSFEETLATDFSQAAQLPLTGYFFKSLSNGRQAKIYISENASIRSYFTVIAVPDGVSAEQFLEEQGWFDVAESQGECLLILEPAAGGSWGETKDEIDYVTEAINFVKSGRNANNVTLFSNFGEFYLVGYGVGAAALEYYAMLNPIFIISQYYTGGTAVPPELINEAKDVEYDGSNTSGYSAGYKDQDEKFDTVLRGLGYNSRLKNSEIPVPTWLNNYAVTSDSANYWKSANDTYARAVDGVFWQNVNSSRFHTLYANSLQKADGKNYGISQVKMTGGDPKPAEDIYSFLSLYTRYDNTFAYSNALGWRLAYAPATVAAQQAALSGSKTEYTYEMTGGETGTAEFWGDGDARVMVPGTTTGGTVNVGVIAFADNGGDEGFDPREFIVYVPDTAYEWGDKGAPVIMVYPGNSQTDRIFLDSTAWWRVANDEGAVIAIICETYNRGGVSVSHYNNDLFYYALKAHLAGYISEKFNGLNLDMGRIYGTGQSAGSMATQGFAFTHPEFFAAVASTSGVSNGNGVNVSIPSYLITGYSDLNNLVPDMGSSSALQTWANYLLTVNGTGKTYDQVDSEYFEAGDRWFSNAWENSQGITLVKWSQNILRSHNCYPAEMPMLFDFMRHFRVETDENGYVVARYYSESGFKSDDAVRIDIPDGPTVGNIESIQAFTDETIYGMGVVEVVVKYKSGTNLSGITADSYILEDRGSLSPDYGQIKIADVEIDGNTVKLIISRDSQATEVNKLVYSGSASEGSRQRNAFGIYPTGAWYRDVEGVIHYGRSDDDEYENNTTGQGYQTRASLELKLRHAGEDPEAAACLANDKGQYVGLGGLWLPTVDREFTEGGFKNLYDLKIVSTGIYDETGIGDKYVRGYYFIPENYDPANGIVFTIQGQGISYWQLEDGTNDAGTGFTYDSATYSWRNKGAIVVNIHDRSTTAKLPEGYDFVLDDVNVMKYFIDTYQITGNIVIQGNSRGTMASNIIIKALAGCRYNPAQQGMGGGGELNKRLDKKVYDFDIDTYICQNGTMGGTQWEDEAWDAIVATGLRVWAFDGEQDSNNIDNIARYKELCRKYGCSDEWIEENVRLTGYTSLLYYPWGETDHSTTRINGWYFSDAAYYGPDLYIDAETGEIVYNTKLADGDKYTLAGYGSAGENNKKDYEYTVYDDLFQVWALDSPARQLADGIDLDSFKSQLATDYSQAAQLPLTGLYFKKIDVDGDGDFDEDRRVKVYFSEETQIRTYFTIIAVPDGVDTNTFLEEQGWFDVADRQGEALYILEPGKGGWGTAQEEEAYVTAAIAFLTGTQNANRVAVFSTFGEFYVAGYGAGAAPLEAWAAKNPILVIAQTYQGGTSAGEEYLTSIASTPYNGRSSNGDITDVLDETIAKVGIDGVIAPKDVPIPTLLYNYSGSMEYWLAANDTLTMPSIGSIYHQSPISDAYATHYANQHILSLDPDADHGISYVIDRMNAGDAGYVDAASVYDDHFALFTRYDTTFPYSNLLNERLNYQEARVAAQREAKDGVVKETLSNGTEIWGQADKVIEGHGTVQVGVIAFADNNGDGKNDPREYLAFIPEGFEGKELPLLMVYAGNSQTDTIFMDSTLWWQIAEKEGIVLMFVCETYNRGGVTVSHYNSDGFYYALLTLAQEKLDGVYADIDFTRIYGTGQSAGSSATQGFAVNSPEMFAAVASTSAAPTPGAAASNRQIPVMMISGQMDAGDMAQAFNSASLGRWANYFLQVNGVYTTFASDTADKVLSGDSRHQEIYVWENGQGIPMVSWGQCLLRPHNPYPTDGEYLWDFMSKYCFTTDEAGQVLRYYSPSGFEEDDLILIGDASVGDAVDLDSYTTALETDYSQAAQLPLTGYFYKTVGSEGRKAKVYISENASIRSYFTVIAVPNGVNTEEFLEEQGWFDVAEANGECLLILEPKATGWGSATAESDYVTAAFNFVKSGQNASRVSVFSNFGEFYLVGYGAGAAPLEYYAAQNPIFIISQYYTDGASNTAALLNDETAGAYEYDGSNTSGYSAGYRDKDEEFDAVLAELGYDHRLRKAEIPVPTWMNGYDEDSDSASYWIAANDVVLEQVEGAYWQKLDSTAFATLYANELQAADGKTHGIAQVRLTQGVESDAAEIYDFLSLYTRYDNTFAYSNALGWRLPYAPATVEAQRNALNGSEGSGYNWRPPGVTLQASADGHPEFTYSMLDGATGTAEFWGEGDIEVSAYDSDAKGVVNVSVIAFADNSGDGEYDPREVIIYIPDSARKLGGYGAPVMMVYPGNSQTDRIFMDSTMWWRVANEKGFVVAIVCETYNRGGVSVSHYNSDLFYYALKAYLEDHIAPEYGVTLDMGRIYASGQSAGSMAVQGFAFTHPEFFAAVASTSGISNGRGANVSIPSYLITGYSDLNNLVPDIAGSSGLQTWANYLLKVNGIDATYAEPSAEGYEYGGRWFTDTWANDEGITLVKWSQNRLRSHNCYPKEMQILYDFAEHFRYETDENNRVVARYYSETAFEGNDAVRIDTPDDEPAIDRVESIQAFTDETIYGMGVVEVVVKYRSNVDTSKITPETYILEDRGSLNPDFGQIKIDSVEIDGQTVKLIISRDSQATDVNKLIYSGSNSEGSRQRNAFGIYATGAWYRDVEGVIHYGRSDDDEYENNTTGQGYQTRASLELKLRHAGEDPSQAAALANEQGQYVGLGGLWLPTVDREFTEGGFKNLYDLKIISTGIYDETGIGDKYVRGYYFIPENYDPANGIVFTIQGQGISYWQLEDGTNDAGTGFTYDSATYSWRNKGAIVVNIHDRSTTSRLPEGYDFVVDDVNVMKYFIDTYNITGNIVIQGNSRGTMASNIIIKALAGCRYNPAQQGMGGGGELNKRLDKKVYDFTIDTYICQNGSMGSSQWEDPAWDAIVATGLRVWAFDGEQDSNNIETIARYKELCKAAGYSDEWIEENVRLTGYTSLLYYPWGETDHSTTRINGWYFSDAAYYGPDLYIDADTGEIVYNTRLADGDKYTLTGYGSAATNSKKDYEYTVYDDLFQVWALTPDKPDVSPQLTAIEEFVTRLYKNFLQRDPDASGLAAWTNVLASGIGTGSKVVAGFVLSREFLNNPLSNEEYVTALYNVIFEREPDQAGLDAWVSVLENGATKKKVLAGFVNSPEFAAICEELGIEVGDYHSDELADLNPDVAAFVARLYRICLNRPYEQTGLDAWVTVLVTGAATGSKVARGFFNSDEFKQRSLSDEDFVTTAYRTLLNREPESRGYQNWLDVLRFGATREEVVNGFLKSKEFGNLCTSYGIER